MSRRFTDVLLVPSYKADGTVEELEGSPPAVGRFRGASTSEDLGGGVFLRMIVDADSVMEASEPRGGNPRSCTPVWP